MVKVIEVRRASSFFMLDYLTKSSWVDTAGVESRRKLPSACAWLTFLCRVADFENVVQIEIYAYLPAMNGGTCFTA